MAAFVLDNSVTVTWLMPDEHDRKSQRLLELVVTDGAVVPPIWRLELANTLLVAVRRKRLTVLQRTQALQEVEDLDIEVDTGSDQQAWGPTLALADRHDLTLYDACYLELAQRRNLPLATLDKDLRKAARSLGTELLDA